ncbi:MAG: hypothetical protein H6713_03300 [Myxococcales bacterium]|nr:hypothetical protein [Myxococcales bacterium]MCB9749015.1 hypothetical protein [Myxococcales bacterium]
MDERVASAFGAARVSVWFEERRPVRALSGFDRRFHRLPERKSESADRFVAAVGRADVEERLTRISAALREHFRLRRRQLRRCEDHLITPGFEYSLSLAVDPDDPTLAVFVGELTHIDDPALLGSDAFAAVFGDAAASMTVALPGSARGPELGAPTVDLEGLIDACEDAGLRVRYPEDCSEARLVLPARGQAVELRFTRRAIELRPAGGSSGVALLDAFTLAVAQLADAGVALVGA